MTTTIAPGGIPTLSRPIEPRIALCMAASPLFTPEMVARYGGSVPDIRRQLEDLVRRGVLGRARGRSPGSTPFYYRLAAAPDADA